MIAAPGGAGHVLVQMVAGLPGRLGLAYLTGTTSRGRTLWYADAALVTGATTARPHVDSVPLANIPSYQGNATDLEGSGCDPTKSPVGTVENNPVTCQRSADVIGIGLDHNCRLMVAWPTVSAATSSYLGASVDATWVSTQRSGPTVCAAASSATPASSRRVATGPGSTSNRSTSLADTGITIWPLATMALVCLSVAWFLRRRRAAGETER